MKPFVKVDEPRPFQRPMSHRIEWGRTFLELEPGPHLVEVWFRDLWYRRAGAADLRITLAPGEVRRVRYRAPLFVFKKGSLTELP